MIRLLRFNETPFEIQENLCGTHSNYFEFQRKSDQSNQSSMNLMKTCWESVEKKFEIWLKAVGTQ